MRPIEETFSYYETVDPCTFTFDSDPCIYCTSLVDLDRPHFRRRSMSNFIKESKTEEKIQRMP